MKVFPEMLQGSEEWFAARRGRPTASEFDKILTPKTLKLSAQAEDYAYKKVGEIIRPDEQEQFNGNWDTDRGNELEPVALQAFIDTYPDLDVRKVGFVTRDDGIVGCSPDFLVYKDGKPIAGGEIKCPRSQKFLKTLNTGELPIDNKIQVHGGMAVTKLKAWYFVSFIAGYQPFIKLVRWDDTTNKLNDALDEFLIMYAGIKNSCEAKLKKA